MTEKEEKLLEIAKEIIELNKHTCLDLKLTGSLMLTHIGINKRREACDIDFLIDECVIAEVGNELCPILPDGFQMDYEGKRSCPTAVKFTNSVMNLSVDFLPTYEGSEIVDGIRCSDVGYLIQAKEMIIMQSSDPETVRKHTDDLDYLYENNDL